MAKMLSATSTKCATYRSTGSAKNATTGDCDQDILTSEPHLAQAEACP